MRVTGPPERPLNIALVVLESVGWNATSLNPDAPPTTPFLAQLSKRSIVAEHAYVVVPSTYKAHVAALCGVEPYFTGDREIFDRKFDFECLPAILREHGYATAYFTSSSRTALSWGSLVKHLGYETFLGHEDMSTAGFEWANMWSYEDDILLEPSREWLSRQSGPFLTTYMVCAPHYEYLAPTRYGRHSWVGDDAHNRYLNAVHYTD
jgi:phosphoglycerol transferase MdoB-like AlkP superfamily enzyme